MTVSGVIDSDELPIPFDDQAEKAVLGACLTNEQALRDARSIVTADDFYRNAHAAVWDSLTALVAAGLPPDPVSALNWLRENRKLVAAGGGATIAALYEAAPVSASVTHHARIVRDLSTRRQVIVAAQRLVHRAVSGQSDAGTLTADAVRELTEVRDRSSSDEDVRWLGELLADDDSYDWLVPSLLERGDRVVFVAGEGSGKTTMLRQMSICLAAGLHPFTLEPNGAGVPVLVVDAENSDLMWRREIRPMVTAAERLSGSDPSWRLALLTTGRLDITTDRDLARVHKLADAAEAQVLAIGPLYKLIGRAVQTDDEAAPLLAALDTFRDRGITILLEAHAGHAKNADGDRDLRPRGSSALLGWPEFGIGLRFDPDDDRFMLLSRWRGDRDRRDWPRRLRRGGRMPFEVERWTPSSVLDSNVHHLSN